MLAGYCGRGVLKPDARASKQASKETNAKPGLDEVAKLGPISVDNNKTQVYLQKRLGRDRYLTSKPGRRSVAPPAQVPYYPQETMTGRESTMAPHRSGSPCALLVPPKRGVEGIEEGLHGGVSKGSQKI